MFVFHYDVGVYPLLTGNTLFRFYIFIFSFIFYICLSQDIDMILQENYLDLSIHNSTSAPGGCFDLESITA